MLKFITSLCFFAISTFSIKGQGCGCTNCPCPPDQLPQTFTRTSNVSNESATNKTRTKVFMPNSEYKRIGHTGIELPHTNGSQLITPTPATNPPRADARVMPVVPKYRRSTAETIQLLEAKLEYVKSLPDSQQNRIETAKMEQQITELRQLLTKEKNNTP